MNTAILTQFRETVQATTDSYTKLKHLFALDIVTRLGKQMELLEVWWENMTSIIDRKQMIYDYQEYSIQKNFMRARDAMEERTLNILCFGFHEHVFNTEILLRQTYDALISNSSNAAIIYTYLKNILQSKEETAARAYQNYTQIYTAYETGDPIFNYKFRRISRRDNKVIVPKPLLNSSLSHNAYARRYSKRLGRDIKYVLNLTQMFESFTDDVFKNVTGTFDLFTMQKLSSGFIDACEDYFHSKSTFYFESVDRPLRIIQERIQNFSSLRREFNRETDEQRNSLRTLRNSLTIIQSGFLDALANGIALAEKYGVENATENVTKLHLAEIFTSKAVSNDVHILSSFFTDLRQKGQFIYEQWATIKTTSLKIWETILSDEDSKEYYKYKHMEDFLQNYTDVDTGLTLAVRALNDDNDLRNVLHNTDNVFVRAVDKLNEELRKYLKENEMDETFIR